MNNRIYDVKDWFAAIPLDNYDIKIIFFNELLDSISTMFEYENAPESVNVDFVERYLCTNGSCGFTMYKGDLIAYAGNTCGEPNAYRIGKQYTGTIPNHSFNNLEIGKECVVGWNNSTMSADIELIHYAELFTQIDLSLSAGVKNSRLSRILYAGNDTIKTALEIIMQKIYSGKPSIVTSKNILSTLQEFSDTKELDSVQLTDPDDIKCVQYLSDLYESLLKRFYTRYGQALQITGKRAQVTTDELDGYNSLSWIAPLDKLKCRRKMCDEINKLFGTNISVKFSELWEKEYENYKQNNAKENSADENGDKDINNITPADSRPVDSVASND